METIAPYISIIAVIVAFGTFVLSGIGSRQTAKQTYVDALKGRIDLIEKALKECEDRCKKCEEEGRAYIKENSALTKRNFELMQDMFLGKRLRDIGKPEPEAAT